MQYIHVDLFQGVNQHIGSVRAIKLFTSLFVFPCFMNGDYKEWVLREDGEILLLMFWR